MKFTESERFLIMMALNDYKEREIKDADMLSGYESDVSQELAQECRKNAAAASALMEKLKNRK